MRRVRCYIGCSSPQITPRRRIPVGRVPARLGGAGSDNRLQLTGQTGALVSRGNQPAEVSVVHVAAVPLRRLVVDGIRAAVYELVNALQRSQHRPGPAVHHGPFDGRLRDLDYSVTYTNMYAAAVPCRPAATRGSEPESFTCRSGISTRQRRNVNVSGSRTMVLAVRNAGETSSTRIWQCGHGRMDAGIQQPLLVDWVYSQRRGAASAARRLLTITSRPPSVPTARTPPVLTLGGNRVARLGDQPRSIGRIRRDHGQRHCYRHGKLDDPEYAGGHTPNKQVTVIAGERAGRQVWAVHHLERYAVAHLPKMSLPRIQTPDDLRRRPRMFTVVARAQNTLGYQWRFKRVTYRAANAPSLHRRNARPNDAGAYTVLVSAAEGNALSLPLTCSCWAQDQSAAAGRPW